MSKKSRDFIFLLFIALFVVGTILVSLYASGYQISLSWPIRPSRLLVKTGMIALDSSPRGATVYLDGKAQANFTLTPWSKQYLTTAVKVKNVLPGEYDLRLELDGYLPLEKRITVYSGQTTFVENINLFRKDAPFFLAEAPNGELDLSSSGKYLYLPAAKKFITLKNGLSTDLPNGTGAWLTDQDKLLIGGQLIGADNSRSDYASLIGPGAKFWRYDESDSRLYYLTSSSLAYYDLNKKTSVQALGGENILAFEPRGDQIYYLADEGNQLVLRRYSLSAQKSDQEITLPRVGHYSFRSEGRDSLTIYDDLNRTLYLFNPDNLTDRRGISNVSSWQWIDDNSLYYNNNWELYRYDRNAASATLLTRVGEKVNQIIFNADKNYLIFSTQSGLEAFDLKLGLVTSIYQTDQIGSLAFDPKNDTVYFWAKIGNQAGVFSLIMQ